MSSKVGTVLADEVALADAQQPKRPRSFIISLLHWVQTRQRPPNKEPLPPMKAVPLPSLPRLKASLSEKPYTSSFPPTPGSTVLYLAYGSNLCRETLQGRRGVRPIAAVNVVVPELKLTFDLPGFPYMEPCFANSARRDSENPDPETENTPLLDSTSKNLVEEYGGLTVSSAKMDSDSVPLIGVVYEVTAEDYAHIIATEGPTYTDVLVNCTALPTPNATSDSKEIPDGEPFKAHTLLAPPSAARVPPNGKPAQPSLRYLNLCRTGAAEHDLPKEWQNYLNGLQHFEITTVRQKIGRGVFMTMFIPLMLLILGYRSYYSRNKKPVPNWANTLMMAAQKGVWFMYDFIFRPIFGDGERTIEKKNTTAKL